MADNEEFTVRDRRSSTPESAGGGGTAGTRKDAAPERPDTSPPRADTGPMPELDFPAFIISLATSAQIGMGAIPHPGTDTAVQDLPAAKQMIDILAMLKEKTKGNLSKEEDALLDQVLFNLRMHYVRVTEAQKKSGGS